MRSYFILTTLVTTPFPVNLTRQLRGALTLVDIRVLDNFVVSFESVVSFSERGWI
ncbi:JAB domain-containing protein [Vibrio cyclitrophicus]